MTRGLRPNGLARIARKAQGDPTDTGQYVGRIVCLRARVENQFLKPAWLYWPPVMRLVDGFEVSCLPEEILEPIDDDEPPETVDTARLSSSDLEVLQVAALDHYIAGLT
jgi:hypothetical protein